MTYRVVAGGELVAEYRERSRWRCLGLDELRAEVESFGLRLELRDDDVIVVRS